MRRGLIRPVVMVLVDEPATVAVANGCSLAAAKRLIAESNAQGKHRYRYSACTREHAAGPLAGLCPEAWAEASAALRSRPDQFLAATLENGSEGVWDSLRLIPIEDDNMED